MAWLLVLALFATGCSLPGPAPDATPTVPTQAAVDASPTVSPPAPSPSPSPTPPPMAARVNDTGITLSEYETQLALFAASSGQEITAQAKRLVLDDLINQALLAQGAAEKGFVVDETLLQTRLDGLVAGLGSQQALDEWVSAHGYSQADFRQELSRAIAAAWMRDEIAAGVPDVAQQVHARQILFSDAEEANEALARLKAGVSFGTLAAEYNPMAIGDLGWFPRGYLSEPELEEAAFSVEPGQYSDIIETGSGFHILQVIERGAQRPLSPDARLKLQAQALQTWLETRRSQSEIEIFVP